MGNQVTNNEYALPLFFTEDVFLVPDKVLSNTVYKDGNGSKDVHAAIAQQSHLVENNTNDEERAETESIAREAEPIIEFSFLGGNKKHILILVNDSDNEVSTEVGNTLLKNILKSVQLKKDDFALVNVAKQTKAEFMQFEAFFKPRVVLAFGVNSIELNLGEIATGEMITQNNVKVIFGSNLDRFVANEKNILWKNLQTCTF